MKGLKDFFRISLIVIAAFCLSAQKVGEVTGVRGTKVISFSGYEWIAKKCPTPFGPGPNYFSDTEENVWVDEEGYLHLKITERDDKWYCAEVISKENLGYGEYIFYLASRADEVNNGAVLGLFTWDNEPSHNNREIDIEISRWGNSDNDNTQYVVQPWRPKGNMHRFDTKLAEEEPYSIHLFNWKKESVHFESLYGDGVLKAREEGKIIGSWTYTGGDIPSPGRTTKARMNFWLKGGCAPWEEEGLEVIIKKFKFIPDRE